MKKIGLMIVALALSAVLLTGCALPSFLNRMTQSLDRETAKVAATSEPLPMAEDALYEYEMDGAMESGLVANIAMPAMGRAMPQDFNTEEYAAVTENGFRKVATDPLSTFSADVDTASYCNLRRMLNDDYAPDVIPAGAVRVEEMLNYFRYDYAAPEGDARFGVTARMAACPWNPAHVLLTLGVRAADAPEASD